MSSKTTSYTCKAVHDSGIQADLSEHQCGKKTEFVTELKCKKAAQEEEAEYEIIYVFALLKLNM